MSTSTSPTTTLAIDDGDSSLSQQQQHYDPNLPPLDERILTLVREAPNLTIRPARLTSELGLSIEDSSAELCGLMSAVGPTATFRFETVADALTMEFTFPKDFERRARNSRRTKDAKLALRYLVEVSFKLVKVVVAFGLIVSLAVMAVFALCAAVAIIVALSRSGGGNDHGRRRTSAMVRLLTSSFRELAWIYVVWGPRGDGEEDHGGWCWRDTFTLFYMNRRRNRGTYFRNRRGTRSWVSRSRARAERWDSNILNGDEDDSPSTIYQQSQPQQNLQQRGILSVAVEFLFGPTPFFPGPSERAKWKIRQRVLVAISSSSKVEKDGNNDKPGVSLAQILPYVDNPPPLPIQSSSSSIVNVTEALKVVSHFNGVPVKDSGAPNDAEKKDHDLAQSRFVFPELMSEEEAVGDNGVLVAVLGKDKGLEAYDDGDDHNKWESFLHIGPSTPQKTNGGTHGTAGVLSPPPMYLKESRHVLTRLTGTQFGQCILLNTLNATGIWFFRQSIGHGGLLEIVNPTGFSLASGLLRFLGFYAKLFFVLPLVRAVYILWLNFSIEKRNGRRRDFAQKEPLVSVLVPS